MSVAPTVAFNGRFLHQKLTGVQRYSGELMRRLSDRLDVIAPANELSPVKGHLWEQFVLPGLCRDKLLWSPGNAGPLVKANQVVTIHDVSILDNPEGYSGVFSKWYRFMLPRLARRVRKVITVSEFSRQRIAEQCNVPLEKVVAILNAVDSRFAPASAEACEAFARRYEIDRPYVVFLGSLEPRKNLGALLRAWAQLGMKDVLLLLAGAPGHVFKSTGFAEPPAGVRLLGRVEDPDLPPLLSGSRCLVYPSLYEGFGLPILEAMACGCPVISSNTTSMPEVGGAAFDPADPDDTGAVLYFDPANLDELVHCLRTVLAFDDSTRGRLKANALKRAGRFSWDNCVAQTWKVVSDLATG